MGMRISAYPQQRKAAFAAVLGVVGMLMPQASMADAKLAKTAIGAFAEICTKPQQRLFRLTQKMERYAQAAGYASLPFEVEFYDTTLEPARTKVTKGTNRKCEIRFKGDYAKRASNAVLAFVETKRFGFETRLPRTHRDARVAGTDLLIARRLQSGPKAVLHTGTITRPNGIYTFITVERLPI